MRRAVLLVLATVGLALATAAKAELRVLTSHLPPFSIAGPEGERLRQHDPGIGAEIVIETLRRLGRSSVRIEVVPWARALERAATEPNTLAFSVARTPDRQERYTWIAQLVTIDTNLVALRDDVPIRSIEDARTIDKIGVLRATGYETLLRAIEVAPARLNLANTEQQNARMLLAGRIDAWAVMGLRAVAMLRAEGFSGPIRVGPPLESSEAYVVARRDFDPAMAARFAAAAQSIREDGMRAAIEARYLAVLDIRR